MKDFNGLLKKGELLLVLGRPGSGCSTLLKSICGELHGLDLDKESTIHYNGKVLSALSIIYRADQNLLGIPQSRMVKEFKGEVVYNQEVRAHPLSVRSMNILLTKYVSRSIAISPT